MKVYRILTGMLLLVACTASAQDYKPFKLGLGLGFALATGNGSAGGALVTIEPAYRVTDKIAVGLRLETAAVTRGYSLTLGPSTEINVAAIGSYTLSGQYYFGSSKFRPFAGLGFGVYTLAAMDVTIDSNINDLVIPAETRVGFYPRIGFDSGHFTMAVEFNVIPSTPVAGAPGEVNNSYLGVRIGGFFFGGHK